MGRDGTGIKIPGKVPARFNPRARMGRDNLHGVGFSRIGVSIHAPAWGATDDGNWIRKVEEVSIHAPAWGATEALRRAENLSEVSIHAPAWGATNPEGVIA